MSEMIPPIGPRPVGAGVETDRERKPGKVEKPDTVSTLLAATRKSNDAISIEAGLKLDPESMKRSMAVIMDKVAQQMTRVFPDNPELREKFGLPEDVNEYSAEKLQDYFSPEKTAQRIVGFTTGFLGAYRMNHANEDGRTQVSGFTDLIRGAIKEGFDEAIEMLGGMEELGEIGENIQRTYDIVMQEIDEFRDEELELLGDNELKRVKPEPPLETVAEEILPPDEDPNRPQNETGGDPFDLRA